MSEGYKHVVDLDLSRFFDTVDHDILMGLVDNDMEDKDIRRLIYVYLKSGDYVLSGTRMTVTFLQKARGHRTGSGIMPRAALSVN